MYVLNGSSFWYFTGDALRSRVWRDVYAVGDVDLWTSGSMFEKRIIRLKDVRSGVE